MRLDTFLEIKNKYGDCGSWAIWREVEETPKSNIGDLTIFDHTLNKSLLTQLKPEFVFVGLNFSTMENVAPFSNFHSPSSKAQDYKIRFALKDTKFWGSYMTDIIKNFPEKQSNLMMEVLNKDKSLEKKNIDIFIQELEVLNVQNKKIIAFGGDAYKILKRNLGDRFDIVKITHYAHFINKENYREEFIKVI